MARAGRKPSAKTHRRITVQLKAKHANLIKRWAHEANCTQGEALGAVLDSLWEDLVHLELGAEECTDEVSSETAPEVTEPGLNYAL